MTSTTLHDANMLIDRVDDDDQPIGSVIRSQVFQLRANFRVAHVLIFDKAERLLVQRLGRTRERYSLHWGSSVASYVPTGKTYAEAAHERMGDELGISDARLDTFANLKMHDNGCTKFIRVFKATHDSQLVIDENHISEVRWVTSLRLLELTRDGGPLTPTFRYILNSLFGDGIPLDER